MSTDIEGLSHLQINAFTGDGSTIGCLSNEASSWVLRNSPPKVRTFLKPETRANLCNWSDPRVGWGLVLVEKDGLSKQQLAFGEDAPEPIRALLADRPEAPVFRYRSNSPHRFQLLRNWRDEKDVDIHRAAVGIEQGALPHYLLIYGTPDEIPWKLQYILNGTCAVGRLTLVGQALENYIQALRCNWNGAAANPRHAIVWATDHGSNDITRLMRNAIAQRVFSKLQADSDIGSNAVFLDGMTSEDATGAALALALAAHKPGLIVTTSHGQTGPLDNLDQMKERLGWLVGQDYQAVAPESILTQWQPDGAIWYAHACCSAGSDNCTLFENLIDNGSPIDRVLKGIAKLNAHVAPLPNALLGAGKPLRAFVGHVEPTFDWTLRQPATGQHLTDTLCQALYNNLYQPEPVGLAFRAHYNRLGSLYTSYDTNLRAYNHGENTRSQMLYALLTARDIQSTVILGDPTAVLPAL